MSESTNDFQLYESWISTHLALSRRYATLSYESIAKLWDSKKKTFWRSVAHRRRDKSAKDNTFYPTVSFRCLGSLLDVINYTQNWQTEKIRDIVEKEIIPKILATDLKKIKSSIISDDEKGGLNIFTLCLLLQTVCEIYKYYVEIEATRNNAQVKINEYAKQLVDYLESYIRKKIFNNLHPFKIYHILRAIRASKGLLKDQGINEKLSKIQFRISQDMRISIEKLVAKYHLGSLSPSESVAMAFCGGSIALINFSEADEYISTALECCLFSQDQNGCWPLGRIIRENKDLKSDFIEISTYEISWVVTEILVAAIQYDKDFINSKFANDAIECLKKSFLYIERSIIRLGAKESPRLGWCSDQPYGHHTIESWTTATVLQSLISYHSLLEALKRQNILASFSVFSPDSQEQPKWLIWDRFKTKSEIDHDFPILKYIDENMVKPILKNSGRFIPGKHSSSALLFGPLGTSKTSIVRAVANGLSWPILLLNPGDFIEHGLEYIEAQARKVFDKLLQISQTVVLFDECDELFRSREPLPQSEQTRGITAFVTACMLPKLQELHDRGRIIFFICTNNFNSMDSAIKRGGRIDHIIGVGPPDKKARKVIVDQTLSELKNSSSGPAPKFFNEAVHETIAETERFTRTEIQRAIKILYSSNGFNDEDHARSTARHLTEKLKKSLIIDQKVYDNFNITKKNYSHPITDRSGDYER